MIVKGVARYGNCSQFSNDEWESFASTMAASVVENISSDSVIFRGWPHYSPGTCNCLSVKPHEDPDLSCPTK